MWLFSKKKIEEKPTWYDVNMEYYKKYGDLYQSTFNQIYWKCFYEGGTTHVNNIPVSCYEEFRRVISIQELITKRLGIDNPFEHKGENKFSFERKNTVNDVLDKLNKFKSEHELDDLETKVIDNMIKQYNGGI